jgi:hypothetical protein
MHHSSYLAWVRNEGTHQTKTVRFKCWNTELVASLNHVLTPYWVSLDSEAETDLYAVSDQMQGRLEMFRKAATGEVARYLFRQIYVANMFPQTRGLLRLWYITWPLGSDLSKPSSLTALRISCEASGAFLSFASIQSADFLLLRLIKRNATSGSSTSYVLSYMHPVYKVGKGDNGT